jgi:prepilin-type N-terminal cleavage/methylation domain-containing protein
MKTFRSFLNFHPASGPRRMHGAGGFTLVEILVCIAIIGLLAGVLLAGLSSARVSAYGAATTSNLRQLQMANIAFATDHEGRYAPAFGSYTGSFTTPWPISPDFAGNYLGTPSPSWSTAGYPTVAKSGFPATPLVGQPGMATIGYNCSDWAGWGGAYFSPISPASFRVTEVHNPSQLIAFADSTDWNLLYSSRASWVPSDDGGGGRATECAVAYRDHGKCIAVAYDGSTLIFTVTDSANKNLWYNDPRFLTP